MSQGNWIPSSQTTPGEIAVSFHEGRVVLTLPSRIPTRISMTNEGAIDFIQIIIDAVKKNQIISK